jgi:hypothetical protein
MSCVRLLSPSYTLLLVVMLLLLVLLLLLWTSDRWLSWHILLARSVVWSCVLARFSPVSQLQWKTLV